MTLGELMIAHPSAGLAFEELARVQGLTPSEWRFGPSEDLDGVIYAVGPGSMPSWGWLSGIKGHPDEWLDLRGPA